MEQFDEKELKEGEIFLYNQSASKPLEWSDKLKTLRLGKQAFDIHGKKLDKSYMLPVFIHKSESAELDRLWAIKRKKIRSSRN